MRKQFINFSLLILGILLFSLPQPTFISVKGFPFLAYISYIPLFLLVNRVSWKTVWLWGLAYGAGVYNVFTYWLSSFHPLGMILITVLYGFQFMLLFPILKAVPLLFKKHGWLVQWLVWCAYEYIKTLGFAGFNYGVTAYSQWRYIVIIQCVEIIGIWGLNAIITFPSAWISKVLEDTFVTSDSNISVCKSRLFKQANKHIISGVIWGCIFICIIVYGIISPKDYSQNKKCTVALLQTNTDPWKGGTNHYEKDLNSLIKNSDLALKENTNIDFVVWPETAFVPKIQWHYKYREDENRYQLVLKLLNYIDSKEVPFILGNDDGVLAHRRDGSYNSVDYNAVLLFNPNENVIPPEPEKYHKVKLVPFTEYFPYEKIFPKIYKALLNGDTHMWRPGAGQTTLNAAGVTFGTPICFEDTFGYIGRNFVNNGAQAFVNLSNDAWSNSLACQYQHLSMAVFRCVENRVPAVRSTASGQTAIINPNGKITKMLEPFKAGYLVGDFPVVDISKKTLYTRYGDWTGKLFIIISGVLILLGLILTILKAKQNLKKKVK
ncbi:MAG: apolipoprotein N-acyltransferase [Treponema sp. CETP13]|nr:MAG: apolipoprotein N-acyltransferase [Treponema sp. CETP13]